MRVLDIDKSTHLALIEVSGIELSYMFQRYYKLFESKNGQYPEVTIEQLGWGLLPSCPKDPPKSNLLE